MDPTPSELDNHANQLNSNNDAYWQSRGYSERPDDRDDDHGLYDDDDADYDSSFDDADGYLFDWDW